LLEDTIDGGDGIVDPEDLDMRTPTFVVFRIPIARAADLVRFVGRANAFATAAYRSDVALVAGRFQLSGDTSTLQCLNANQLAAGRAGRVFKVFDSDTCAPDFLMTAGLRLADFLGDGTNGFRGGMVYDISHGNQFGIYDAFGASLSQPDLDRLPSDALNVFVSISCANDARVAGLNFAMDMFLHGSVAVISASVDLFPLGLDAIVDAEVNAFQALYATPRTLLEGLQLFRASYYERYAIAGPLADRPYHWSNLLAVQVIGDGLAVVASGN
jgi:hypothetical protein